MGSLLEERPQYFYELYLILFLGTILTHRKKLGLILFVRKMASLSPKEVGADQVLGPEFLGNVTV